MTELNQHYLQHRHEMRDGDVLMFKGQSWLSKIIKWRTQSAYSHAGIVVWWNDRLMVLEAIGQGVLARPISYNLHHYTGDIEYFRPAREIAPETRTNMAQFAQAQLGKKYASRRLIGFFFKLLFNRPMQSQDNAEAAGRYFCSEYVADIYAKNGFDLDIERSSGYTSPDRLARAEGLTFVATLNRAKTKSSYATPDKNNSAVENNAAE